MGHCQSTGTPHSDDIRRHGSHASLGGYLIDQTRSTTFFIDRGESVDDIVRGLFKIYLLKPWNHKWAPHSSQLPGVVGWWHFYEPLKLDARLALYDAVTGNAKSVRGRGPFKSEEDRSECLDVLRQIDVAQYFSHYHGHNFITWLLRLWNVHLPFILFGSFVTKFHLIELPR